MRRSGGLGMQALWVWAAAPSPQDGRLWCSQLCLHGGSVSIGPHSELLRALYGESWDTRQGSQR